MLNAICFLISIVAAVGGAREAKAGFGGYSLAIAIGITLGVACTWAMWTVGERVGVAVQPYPEAKRELYFRVLYLAAVLWILIVVVIADHVTSATMRLVV